MHRLLTNRIVVFLIASGFLLSPVAAQDSLPTKIESLSWLAGKWNSVEGGRDIEEHWMSPKAGLMLGMNRTVNTEGTGSFEFLRIAEVSKAKERPGIVYYASPGGQSAVPFAMIAFGEQTVVFQNLENDFPHRIFYKREADTLTARIEGTVDGREQSIEWHWNRMPQ